MRSVEEHIDRILASVPEPDSIELALLDAQGLLCAEEVVSDISLPSYDQTATDSLRAGRRAERSAEQPFFDRGPGYARLSGGSAYPDVDLISGQTS